jgi:hypothetical protein
VCGGAEVPEFSESPNNSAVEVAETADVDAGKIIAVKLINSKPVPRKFL